MSWSALATRSRHPSADAAFSECVDRLADAALPGLVSLGALDGQDMPRLVAVGEAVERAACLRLRIESLGEVGRHGHLSRCRVELDVDVDLVPTGDASAGAI